MHYSHLSKKKKKQLTYRLSACGHMEDIDERAKRIELEIRCKNLETSLQESQINHVLQLQTMQQTQESLARKYEIATEQEKRAKMRLSVKEEECFHLQNSMDEVQRITALQTSLHNTSVSIANYTDTNQDVVLNDNLTLMKENHELLRRLDEFEAEQKDWRFRESALQESLSLHQAQIESLQGLSQSIDRLTLENEQLKCELEADRDAREYNAMLKSKLEKLKELEAEIERVNLENKALKQNQENIRLLKEEYALSEMRAAAADELRDSLARVNVENEDLRKQLQEKLREEEGRMNVSLQHSTSFAQSPSLNLAKQCNRLRHENCLLTDSNAELSSRVREMEEAASKLDKELAQFKNERSQFESRLTELQRGLDMMQMRFRTKEKECLVFRESVEKMDDLFFGGASSGAGDGGPSLLEKELRAQIRRLTELLDSNNQLLERWQPTSSHSGHRTSTKQSSVKMEDKAVSCLLELPLTLELRERIAELEGEKESLQVQCEDLALHVEHLEGMGMYDSDEVQVIHFAQNPSAKSQAAREETVEDLKAQIKKWRQRCTVVEEKVCYLKASLEHSINMRDLANFTVSDLPTTGTGSGLDPKEEIESLKRKLKTKESQQARLLSSFDNAAADFRAAMKTLLGFHLNSRGDGVYEVSSIYAQDYRRESFRFKVVEGEPIRLVETAFSRMYQEEVNVYFGLHRSVPGLLATVQKKLFEEQTIIG